MSEERATPTSPILHVALLEPEIPPNTGNIARMCAATGSALHLIGRLGFQMDDRNLRRAGIDYWHAVDVRLHDSLEEFETGHDPQRIFCLSAHARERYTSVRYRRGDVLLFGSESRGLPAEVLQRYAGRVVTIPMPGTAVRSLNLSTAAGIVVYEALRQIEGW
jgi:tRNA (cytidine/uridine-2'-O-)-methyltransferase